MAKRTPTRRKSARSKRSSSKTARPTARSRRPSGGKTAPPVAAAGPTRLSDPARREGTQAVPANFHALYDRGFRSSRGLTPAAATPTVSASARKLAILFWCMLTRGEDYAHQQPSLTNKKLRRLEITAGAPARKGKPSGVWVTHQRMRQAERQLAAQAEASYKRLVTDRQLAAPTRPVGASVTAERAETRPPKGNVARQATELQTPAL